MPLHQISVIPRDVTSSRVSGSGKAKDKDKQVREGFERPDQVASSSAVVLSAEGCVTHMFVLRVNTCTGPEQRGSRLTL